MPDTARPILVGQILAENIRLARKGAGLSQEQLGERAGLHRTEISQIERGNRIPRADTLFKIAVSCNLEHPGSFFHGLRWTPPAQLGKGTWVAGYAAEADR
jgi:transcriptional regulator with XRE-family HTH domain